MMVIMLKGNGSSFNNKKMQGNLFFVRQEIQQLRSAVVRKKEEKKFEETKEKMEKKPEVQNTSSQTYGRGGSFRRQKRER